MIALIQRVTNARIEVNGVPVGSIGRGILALIGVIPADTQASAQRLYERILGYRIFPDSGRKMNLSVHDIAGGVLLVPQFTLAADTRTGTRPGFSTAAPPELAKGLFEGLVISMRRSHSIVETGRFGAEIG